jgi:hypothetical protein
MRAAETGGEGQAWRSVGTAAALADERQRDDHASDAENE